MLSELLTFLPCYVVSYISCCSIICRPA